MTNVPAQYQSYVNNAAAALGISPNIVAAQINMESGFNPNAISPAGAQGIAQFMPGTWQSEGSGSPFNVADAFAAYTKYMKSLINQEGGSIQRALEAYNAGPGNLGAGAGYASSILSAAGSGLSVTADTSGTSGGGSITTPAPIDASTLAEQYGFTSAFLNANPELKNIFNQAVTQQWSTDKFKASLMTTNWWKSHSDTERTYLTLLATDPAAAKQKLAQANLHAWDLGHQIGLQPGSAAMNAATAAVGYNIAAKGWTDEQAKYYLGQYVSLSNGKMYGDSETQYSNGLQYAYSMGVKMSDSFYQGQVQNIEKGTATFADMQAAIRQQAKAQYSQFATQIDGGQTVQDLASPYIQQMGTILETNPNALSAFDPTIAKALQYKDPTTGALTSQPLWAFENTLRQDPRWLQTNNARDSMYQVAHQVLQNFGKAF
jgi:hypothetical protein